MNAHSGSSSPRSVEAQAAQDIAAAIFSELSTRSRILLLVFSCALPIIALSLLVALEQRTTAEARARAEIQWRAELAGVLLTPLDFDMSARVGAALHREETLSVLDGTGAIIARYTGASANPEDAVLSPGVLHLIMKSETDTFEETKRNGKTWLYAVRRVPTDGRITGSLAVVVGVPKNAIYRDVDRALIHTLFGIAAVTLVLLLTAWYGTERLVLRPIRIMLEMTQRVRAGDLAVRTGLPAGHEELCQLGAALDEMADQLQLRESKLRQALDELREQAVTDSLTGLYNRRYFSDALAREVLAARRKRAPFSVILLDIDHFKKVNDTWGHDAGDVVLKEIAAVIRSSVRGSDTAVRHGGEEFAMLLPDTTAVVAQQRAEELRRALEALEVRHGSERIKITASFGVAEYTNYTDEGAALMNGVDEAMYAAKKAGRNKVVVNAASVCPGKTGRA